MYKHNLKKKPTNFKSEIKWRSSNRKDFKYLHLEIAVISSKHLWKVMEIIKMSNNLATPEHCLMCWKLIFNVYLQHLLNY